MKKNIKFKKSSGSVFKDAGFSTYQARNLEFRSYLMMTLRQYINQKGWTQQKAAKKLDVTQPRISNLIHGKIDLFSVGMLINMFEKAGFKLYDIIEKNIKHEFKLHHRAFSKKESNSCCAV